MTIMGTRDASSSKNIFLQVSLMLHSSGLVTRARGGARGYVYMSEDVQIMQVETT